MNSLYAWLTETFGEQSALYIAYGGGALVILLLIWVLWFWTRRVSGGVFVHGGRGRKPRLAVVDATAIDSHRRIVLVRRDDVEHLVMIGGHNDFVIERGIGKPGTDKPVGEPAVSESGASMVETATAAKEDRVRAGAHKTEATAPAMRERVRERQRERKQPPQPQQAVSEAKTEPEPRDADVQAPPPAPAPAAAPVAAAAAQPVAAPEPPQSELPGAYAELDEEPKLHGGPVAAALARASGGARSSEQPVIAEAREPAFDISAEPDFEAPPADDAPPPFEEHVRASTAEAETGVADKPADDGSLEDEMQKLLAELTRKK